MFHLFLIYLVMYLGFFFFRDIMYLSNTLVYNGCLKCGNDSVANNRLKWAKDGQLEKVFIH